MVKERDSRQYGFFLNSFVLTKNPSPCQRQRLQKSPHWLVKLRLQKEPATILVLLDEAHEAPPVVREMMMRQINKRRLLRN